MELQTVLIQNTENNTVHEMHVRSDRLLSFALMGVPEESPTAAVRIPGISGVASLGLSTIFTDIPYRFPVESLLAGLRRYVSTPCSLSQVEKKLELMAQKYPQIDFEGYDQYER